MPANREEIIIPMVKINPNNINTYLSNYLTTNLYAPVVTNDYVLPVWEKRGFDLSAFTSTLVGTGALTFDGVGASNTDILEVSTGVNAASSALAVKKCAIGDGNYINFDYNVYLEVVLTILNAGNFDDFAGFQFCTVPRADTINTAGYEIYFEQNTLKRGFATYQGARFYQAGAAASFISNKFRVFKIVHLAGVSGSLYEMDSNGIFQMVFEDNNPAHLPSGSSQISVGAFARNPANAAKEAIYIGRVSVWATPAFNTV